MWIGGIEKKMAIEVAEIAEMVIEMTARAMKIKIEKMWKNMNTVKQKSIRSAFFDATFFGGSRNDGGLGRCKVLINNVC